MWMMGQFEWTYYEIYLHREVPDPFAGDIIFFLRGIPLIAALALRPHLKRDELRMGLGYLDFALLLTWWTFVYAFFCAAVDVRQLLGRPLQLRVQRAEHGTAISGDGGIWLVLAWNAKCVADCVRVSLLRLRVVYARLLDYQCGDFPARLLHRELVRPAAAERLLSIRAGRICGFSKKEAARSARGWQHLRRSRIRRKGKCLGLAAGDGGGVVASLVRAVCDASGTRHNR